MAFLAVVVIIIIELLISALIHIQYGVSLSIIVLFGVFIGWANAFLYLFLDGN